MWGFPKHIHSPHLTFLEFLQAYTIQVLDLFREFSSAYIPVWVWIFHKQSGCWYWFRVPPQHIHRPSVNETDVLLDRKLTAPSCMTALGWQSLVYTVNQLTYSDMTKQQLDYEQVDERWPSDMLDWEWLRVMYAQLISCGAKTIHLQQTDITDLVNMRHAMLLTALGWWLEYTVKTEIVVLWWRMQ